MLSLLELQRGFRRALLAGDSRDLDRLLAGDGMAPGERLDVYRNNVGASLTEVLKSTFPAVCRLVDERFFAYAASEFIRASPPAAPCLSEYGGRFPMFLAAFPPCRELLYLADVARLEWAVHCAARAPEGAPLALAALHGIDPQAAPQLIFRLQPSYAYLPSVWPVDLIWRANRPGEVERAVDLDADGVRLELRRHRGDVEMRRLPPAVFAFRQGIGAGKSFGEAAEAALAEDEGFDVSGTLADLIGDGAVTGFTLDEKELP